MKISARNVWLGNVAKIETGAVNSVVTVGLKGPDTIVSVITDNSVKRLELEPGSEVLAIVKAPSVLLALEVDPKKISARNILAGTIRRIVPGVVNDEVTIDLSGGNTVTSILTSESVRRLGLREGMAVTVALRPEKIHLSRKAPEDGFNSAQGTVKELSYFGSFTVYHLELPSGMRLKVSQANVQRHRDDQFRFVSHGRPPSTACAPVRAWRA